MGSIIWGALKTLTKESADISNLYEKEITTAFIYKEHLINMESKILNLLF